MNNPEEILKLAYQRLKEASILCENKMYDGAFYLAGYSIELALKAKICKRIGIHNIFDEKDDEANKISGISEIRKLLKTHSLITLLIISGLKIKFENDKAKSKELTKVNSILFNEWDEKARYRPCGHADEKDVKKLVSLLSDKNFGLLKWIEMN